MAVLEIRVTRKQLEIETGEFAYGRWRIILRAAAGATNRHKVPRRVWSWRTEDFPTGLTAFIAETLGAKAAPWQTELMKKLVQ